MSSVETGRAMAALDALRGQHESDLEVTTA